MFDLSAFYRACDEQDGAEIAALFSEPGSEEMRKLDAEVRREIELDE